MILSAGFEACGEWDGCSRAAAAGIRRRRLVRSDGGFARSGSNPPPAGVTGDLCGQLTLWAAAHDDVGLQTVRDWMLAFNAQGPNGLIDGKAPGARPRLNVQKCAALRSLVEQGPLPAAHGVVRRQLIDLARILFEDQGVSVS